MPKRILLALAGMLALSAQVSAQTPPPPNDLAEQERLAREEYNQGLVQYNLLYYDKAIEHFRRAYEIRHSPPLLFNIAQAYRLKKDCATAKTFYQNYLREEKPTPQNEPNRADAEKFIAEMDACIAGGGMPTNATTEPASTLPATPPRATPTETSPATPAQPDEGGRPGAGMKLTGMIVGVGGLALFGVGMYFVVHSAEINDDAEGACMGQPASCLADYDDKGKLANTLAWTFGGLGGAAMVTGGVLYYLGMQREESAAEVSFAPTPGGAALVVSGRF